MFLKVFAMLKNVYCKVSDKYARLAIDYSMRLIVGYFMLIVICSLGIVHFKLDEDNERLTIVRHSRVEADEAKLNSLFAFDQNHRYFQHQMTNIGYYFEVIIILKLANANSTTLSNSERCQLVTTNNNSSGSGSSSKLDDNYNIINKTFIDEYNMFYDELVSLEISATDDDNDHNNNHHNKTTKYSYKHGLCARRLNKCAVEGGLMRHKSFQDQLLAKEVFYDVGDPMTVYLDTTATDGSSLDFVFGKCRHDECNKLTCKMTRGMAIRNRFDLLAQTSSEKRRAVRFMHAFVEHMDALAANGKYPHFEFSYHTSHTLESEIRKYSVFDFYVIIDIYLCCVVDTKDTVAFLLYYFKIIFNSIDQVRMRHVRRLLARLLGPRGEHPGAARPPARLAAQHVDHFRSDHIAVHSHSARRRRHSLVAGRRGQPALVPCRIRFVE